MTARRITKAEAEARIASAPPSACTMCALASGPSMNGAANASQGSAPIDPIAANEVAVAVLAPYAVRPGHVLVVLRRHAVEIAGLSREEWLALNDLTWSIARALEQTLAPVRTYVAALGAATALPMSFPHVHQHVVPLSDGGEADRPAEVFTWRNGVYLHEDDALAGELRRAIARPHATGARVGSKGEC